MESFEAMEGETPRFLTKASEIYDLIATGDGFRTSQLFNEEAPEPVVAFAIGGVLSFFGIIMWINRVRRLQEDMRKKKIELQGSDLMRAYISCAIDSDNPFYVIVSYAAASFIFLGGLQLDYEWALLAMISTYVITSSGEVVRVLLAFQHAESLEKLVVTSDLIAAKIRGVSTDLKPANVYEDLGRDRTIVMMTFCTQCILIAFVCIDIYEKPTTSCRDGTPNCPIGGTLGSWGFYVLGIFMACVFQLGPKTKFGESEQNPAYWLQLLLATKKTGAKVTWFDPIENTHKFRMLETRDWRTWTRFMMSYLINGVGFHILVHALPIQVAAQSSFTGVVFRAVGMMYLVDLDDTPGYTLTIVQQEDKDDEDDAKKDEKPSKPEEIAPTATAMSTPEISAEAHKIIEEARAKLDALARGEKPATLTNQGMLGVATLANAGEMEDGDKARALKENV